MKFEYELNVALKKIKICEIDFQNTSIYSLVDENSNEFRFLSVPSNFDLYNCMLGNYPDIVSDGKLNKHKISEELIKIMRQTKIGIGVSGVFSFVKREALESLFYLAGNIRGASILKKPSFNRDVFLASLLEDKHLYAVIIQKDRPLIIDFMKKGPENSKKFLLCANSILEKYSPAKYNILINDGISIKYEFDRIGNYTPVVEIIDTISTQLPLNIKMYLEYSGLKIGYKDFKISRKDNINILLDKLILEYPQFIDNIKRLNEFHDVPEYNSLKNDYEKLYCILKNKNITTVSEFLDTIIENISKYKNFDISEELKNIFFE